MPRKIVTVISENCHLPPREWQAEQFKVPDGRRTVEVKCRTHAVTPEPCTDTVVDLRLRFERVPTTREQWKQTLSQVQARLGTDWDTTTVVWIHHGDVRHLLGENAPWTSPLPVRGQATKDLCAVEVLATLIHTRTNFRNVDLNAFAEKCQRLEPFQLNEFNLIYEALATEHRPDEPPIENDRGDSRMLGSFLHDVNAICGPIQIHCQIDASRLPELLANSDKSWRELAQRFEGVLQTHADRLRVKLSALRGSRDFDKFKCALVEFREEIRKLRT